VWNRCGITPSQLTQQALCLPEEENRGNKSVVEKTIVSEMSYAARDALGGAGWDVSSLQYETLVMQNRIIIQVNHKPKLLVEGIIMWMERT